MGGDLFRWLKWHLNVGLSRLARRPRLTPSELLARRPARILIVRQHDRMGDLVCATPALRAIRQTFPAAEITLVTAPANAGIVRHNPDLDHVLTYEGRDGFHPGRLWTFVSHLRQWRPDMAFVLSSVSFSATSASIALVSGAPVVVGSESLPFGLDLSRRCFSLEMPARPELDRHAVAHSLAPLQAIGVTTDDLSTCVVPAPSERERAGEILAELSWEPGFWAVHPGAGKAQNVWPALGFAAVVRRAEAAGRRVLILHGPADAASLTAFRREMGLADAGEGRVRIPPPCPVGVSAALLELADRFLCNDTGIMHVAGALRVPTLALFGPTDPALWKPRVTEVLAVVSPRRIPHPRGGEFGWMEAIAPGTVWRAWSEMPGRDGRKDRKDPLPRQGVS